MENSELHIISNGRQKIEEFAEIIGEIHPYLDAVHIREKTKSAKEIFEAVTLLTDYHVPLTKIIINDRVDVAYVKKVLGVQLGYQSMNTELVKREFPSLRVGCSVHSLEEGLVAEQQGADFVLFGHVFPTSSKPGLTPKGVLQLSHLCNHMEIPVIAIGGIDPSNLNQVLDSGAKGVAVMSGVLEASDPLKAVKEYSLNLLGKGVETYE